MEFKGSIVEIFETQVISEKFSKREVVINDNGEYPQEVIFQFTQDRCSLLDGFKVGDIVTLGINIRGRRWVSPKNETKFFNTLEAWKISGQDSATPQAEPAPAYQAPVTNDDEDILPF
jgi:single-strand DNA-binding protein